ncbi:hypothetical protein [Streptomyces doebereineriae]|uniref:Secreted protein n=1 Tax=Streptomyces doebereineriae TaxID=3075528 RepID=A0ABU2V344_9ACTN|nr:hypothetical protein [Streptomyces sp. DSM 41640]MDT0479803.1 hypothetical protein [Streptomyces sp. DSM 41640]
MDEGLAALLAGAGALIGALVGAVASFRGARIGAERALEAVLAQVQQQALAEHAHWAREHRKTAWIQALDEAANAVGALEEMASRCRRGEGIPGDLVERVRNANTVLSRGAIHLNVWGPEAGAAACVTLHSKTQHQFRAVLDWARAVASSGDTEAAARAYEDANAARLDAYTTLLYLARAALRDGMATST